jgi:beta-glucosidase
MKLQLILIAGTVIFSTNATAQEPFRNPALPIDVRVKDLVSRLTLQEKVAQMMENAPAIERMGIPAYNWWNEALHGVARSKDTVTVFPQAIGMAANFDVQAMETMGQITSDEARAIYHHELGLGKPGQQYKGLTFWTPNINIFRDPRWGRGQETYGEDPYLTGQLGMAIVRGLQGNDPKYLKTSACAKHFAVHSGPETGRHTFDVAPSDTDLWNTYLPAFRNLVVDAQVSSVMCAYNGLEGKPCCGNDKLMIGILRNNWGFKGYVTSDCGAINDIWKYHKAEPNASSASAKAVFSGTDLECGEYWNNLWSYKSLADAVKDGLLNEDKLNESLARLFTIRFRLGMFDPQEMNPYSKIPISSLGNNVHLQHSLKMTRQSLVLLKNNGVLPLSGKIKTIAVVGPNADDAEVLLGNYNGIPKNIITPLKGIIDKMGSGVKIIYKKMTTHTRKVIENETWENEIKEIAAADVILFIGGISPRLEGEEGDAGNEKTEGFLGGDRTTIQLPKVQSELMKLLKKTGKPLIFINMSGSAVAMQWEATNADAILQAWYGGQFAGQAIAEVLFGDYNPSGKLPVTFYKSDNDLPSFTDYSMKNRTYRYFKGKALYPFGHGLSYTAFNYNGLKITGTDSIHIELSVKNTGKYAGAEVVQLYIKNSKGPDNFLNKELKEFKRVDIKAGDSKTILFTIARDKIGFWKQGNEFEKTMGDIEIQIGSSSDDIRLKKKCQLN